MRWAATGVVAAALFVLPGVAQASVSDATLARRGLTHALHRHWLKPADVTHYRALLWRAGRDMRRLPKLRAQVIASQLSQLMPMRDSYVSPRALALFTQLQVNLDYLETHRVPSERVDVTGDDGVVYRWFPGHGLEFHPLASFSALNASRDPALAEALVARGIPRGDRLIWEYSFRFGSGHPPWASGMAQAVAAQALSRAGLPAAAQRAYASVPPLTMQLRKGPWIRLYGFTSEIVLNAQLQTAVSLLEYADTTGDQSAAGLAQRLLGAAQAYFPSFDTGDWSRYELRGAYASRSYQEYVTTLLRQLAAKTENPFWTSTSQRFRAYLSSPATITQPIPTAPIWPQPADGYLDTAILQISLSQRASVTLAIAGKVTTYRLSAGAHTLTWKPPAGLAAGTYPVSLSTVTYAGNRATVQLQPLVVDWDTQPPATGASVGGNVLSWQSTDEGTPSLALAVDLVDPAGVQPPQTLDLGQLPLNGTLPLAVPPGTWEATLRATNSAGLTTTIPLGQLTA